MKRITLLFLLFANTCFAQSEIIATTIEKIEMKSDTIESVYKWVADNIKYDVNKLNEIKKGMRSRVTSKFKTVEEYKTHLLKQVVRNKKGVCQDYSLIFDAIVKELGYESYIIQGYTKNSKGKVNRSFGHTWNAVKVNNKWKLFDPTWGAGYVEDEKRFVQKYKEQWYDVDPSEMIKTHMPFDPIWQLSNSPMTYQDFENNLSGEASQTNYDFESLIAEHSKKEKKLQMQDHVNRSNEMGKGTRLIDKWRKSMTKNIGVYGIRSQQDLLDEANENASSAVDLYNKFVTANNKKFKGKKFAKDIATQNLEEAKEGALSAIAIYKSIEVETRKANGILIKAIKHSERLLGEINKQLNLL